MTLRPGSGPAAASRAVAGPRYPACGERPAWNTPAAVYPALLNFSTRSTGGQPFRVGLDFSRRFGDLVHVLAFAEQHRLCKPDGLLAKLVVHRAAIALTVGREAGGRKQALEAASAQRVLDERLFV